MRHPAAMLEPGVFVKGFKDYIIFIHKVKGNVLNNIRIYQPREDGATRTIIAERGEIIPLPERNSVQLKLENGIADEISAEKPAEFYKLSFQEYYMTLNVQNAIDVNKIQKKPREKSIKELKVEINQLSRDSIEVTPLRIEMHKKIALAFSNFVFVLAAIPLAIGTHRREKFIGFGLAIILFLLYWSLMLGGIAVAIRGIIAPWLGVWAADIILAVMGIILFYKVAKK
jgi:lipopolysaccharide export system permease protein